MKREGNLREYIPSDVSLRITARVHQGDLAKALEERGWTYQNAADFLSVTYSRFSNLICLRFKELPKDFIHKFTREQEQKLLELTGKLPEDLWPEWLQDQDLTKKQVFLDASPKMLHSSGMLQLSSPTPDDAFEREELRNLVHEALKTLTPREEQIMRLRFGLDGDAPKTFDEIGRIIGVHSSRIQQIYFKALSELRHPSRASKLKKFFNSAIVS